MLPSHRPRHRHRRSGIRRVWTAEVLVPDLDGRALASAWPILEESIWGLLGRKDLLSKKIYIMSCARRETRWRIRMRPQQSVLAVKLFWLPSRGRPPEAEYRRSQAFA